jgi:uncharacterized OsmC-like protein
MAEFQVRGRSTETFGRVLVSARNHYFVADGPVQNGCPGEALTPAELFLAGVAACGVELMQVIARERQVPLQQAGVEIFGVVDRTRQPRPDLTVFNSVRLEFTLQGVTGEQATLLLADFKGR